MTETHFTFANAPFRRGRAHDGTAPILSHRVRVGSAGSGYNFIDMTIVPPGADIGRHGHAFDNEEIYVVVAGCGSMMCNGTRVAISPGDVVINPPGGVHSLENTGDEEIRLVVIELKRDPGPET